MNSARQVPFRGELASTPISEVLRSLEVQGANGRVHFDTEIGGAEVFLIAGKIVDASVLGLTGRPALFRLVSLSEGTFELVPEPVDAKPPLTESVAHLLADHEGRMAEWRSLIERAPPMSTKLLMTPAGLDAVNTQTLLPQERTIFALIDGQRTLSEVLDECGLDAVDALGILVFSIDNRLVRTISPQASLFPLPASNGKGDAPKVEIPKASPAFGRKTVMGLGFGEFEPVPAKAAVRRIINVDAPQGDQPPTAGLGTVKTEAMPVAVMPPARAEEPSGDAPPKSRGPFVGRYEVLFRIGFGGMGSVYLCRLNSEGGFKRLFALKLLRNHLTRDSAAAKRFFEEARLAGQIHHPNVVSVLDAGLHGSEPYLVMEYVEGGSLKQLLTAHETVRPPELIVPIALDALAGLHAAHTLLSEDGVPLELVHCDVSPENLLVGIDGICRLTDFGVARHGEVGRGPQKVTHGKPSYLAPEQVLGGKVDARSDVFAMGVVLYNALTGIKLFEGSRPEETLQRVVNQRIELPSTVGLRPPPCFDFVCMKALERDPERRFASAEDMMIELRRIALREQMLSPPSAIASWVRESVGHSLAQRRLAVLDASRKGPPRLHPSVPPQGYPVAGASAAPGPLPSSPSLPRSDPPSAPGFRDPGLSQTIALPPPSLGRRYALILASVLALCAVLATLIWPSVVSRLFRLNIEGTVSADLPDAGVPSGDAGLPVLSQDAGLGAPSAAPAASGAKLK
jgi:serine/threonine protein kinase